MSLIPATGHWANYVNADGTDPIRRPVVAFREDPPDGEVAALICTPLGDLLAANLWPAAGREFVGVDHRPTA